MEDFAMSEPQGGLEFEMTVTTAVTRSELGAPSQTRGFPTSDRAQVSIHVQQDRGVAHNYAEVDDEEGQCLAFVATSSTSVVRTHLKQDSPSASQVGRGLATVEHQRLTPGYGFATQTNFPANKQVSNTSSSRILQSTLREAATDTSMEFSCSLSTTIMVTRHGHEDDRASSPEPITVEEVLPEEQYHEALPGRSEVATSNTHPDEKKKFVIFLPRPRNWDRQETDEIAADETAQAELLEDNIHFPSTSTPALQSQNLSHPTMLPKPSSSQSQKHSNLAQTTSSNERLSAIPDSQIVGEKRLLSLEPQLGVSGTSTTTSGQSSSITRSSELRADRRGTSDVGLVRHELTRPRSPGEVSTRSGITGASTTRGQLLPPATALARSELTVTYSQYQATQNNLGVQSSMHLRALHLQPIASSSTSDPLLQVGAEAPPLDSLSGTRVHGSHSNQSKYSETEGLWQGEGPNDANDNFLSARALSRASSSQPVRIDNATDGNKTSTSCNIHVNGEEARDIGIEMQTGSDAQSRNKERDKLVPVPYPKVDDAFGCQIQATPVPMPVKEAHSNDVRRRVSASGLTITDNGVLKIVSVTGEEAKLCSRLDEVEESKDLTGHTLIPQMSIQEISINRTPEPSQAATDMDRGGKIFSKERTTNESRDGDKGPHCDTDMDKTLSSLYLIPGRAMEQHILIDDVTQFGEKTVAEAVVSTEISTESDGVLDAVLTEHFVLVAMQPPQTVGQHVESATLPDSPSSTSCELPEAGMSGDHSIGRKPSTTKRDNSFSSAPRVSTLPRETQKLFLADSEAKSNLYTAINTSDGPDTICAIHKPDEDLPESNCFLHKPDEVTTARSSTPPFSPLLDTGTNPTPQPSLASELAGELSDGGPSGPAKEPEEATAASTALHLETETKLKAPVPVQEGIAISKFQSSQIEGEPSSTTRSANSALVGPSNNEMHLQQVSEQGLHPASQPRQRVGQESQTTGGVLEQDRRGEGSMTVCRQQVPPTEVQVCQVPGPCPFCLGHRLLATGKAKLNIFDSSQITSEGSAANQDQSAFTQGTEAGSSQESDKGQQGSSPDSPQLALSPVIAAPAVLFTGTHHKDSSGEPSTSTIYGLTNRDRQLDSAAKDGDIPTSDAYIKEGPEKPSDPTKLQVHLLRGHEAQAFKQEGEIFPSVDTPVEKELNTQENSTQVLRVESDLFFVDQQDHSRTNTELDHEIARQSQLSPTPLELEMPSLNATVQSNLVATSKQSSPTDGHANATNKDTCMHDNLQGPVLLKGPSSLGSKRGSTTTTVLASLPPADGFASPLRERTITSSEACPQEVPSGSAEHQDTNSADKTCCYPAANKKERRLTETTNMQETLLGFPTPEKDTSTATTPQQTVQQKTSDASDSVPPNPGEARDLEHQGSGGKICCYPLVRRDSKSTIQDTCMHDNQIGLNQPNHQSSHTTASKDGSKESEKLGAEKPLDTTITTSILLADCSENLAGEQKSPQGSFHVPRLSTCCFPLKTTAVESQSKDSPGTFATVATEPSIKENENENTDSSVKTCCYPASYKKKGGLTATTNMQEPLIESPTIEHQGSGGKICCYPIVRREKNSTIQDTCMHDNQIGLNQPNHQSIHTTASKDGSEKSEKLGPETPLDTTINTSIPLADRSENLADEQKSPQGSFHVPRLSTCCFPVKTTAVESQSKDSPETFATVATEPSIKENENQNTDSAVKTCCYPTSYKKNGGLTATTNMQEPLIESPTIEHQGSGGKICCYPIVRREKNSTIQDTCMHDNQIGLNQPNHQSIHTTASKDGSEKSEKLGPETPLDTTINTSIPLADRSENLADEQKSPQGSFHVPRLSTCCFPVKTTAVESQSKDSPETFATVATEPSIKENENQNTDSAVKTCCYPTSYKKNGGLTATTNMQEPLIESPTIEHQGSGGKICCYPLVRREKNSTIQDTCMHDNQIGLNQPNHQSIHTTESKDGSEKSEKLDPETPLDTTINTSISLADRSENLADEQKSPQGSFHVPRLSTCCFPVKTTAVESQSKDSPGTFATVATEPSIKENENQNTDSAVKTCCYPASYKKKGRLTATTNMQEPFIVSPTVEKDTSAATVVEQNTQQKTSDVSDSLPPNPEEARNLKHQVSDGKICCYPVARRESKSTSTIRVNQSDPQLAHTTALKDGSQESEDPGAETARPLDTRTNASIPVVSPENLVDEQKSPQHSFHVPKLSTCCFPVTGALGEDNPKDSLGTSAIVATEPPINESKHQNRDAADKTCCYPDAYKKERRVTSTKNMQEPVIESPPPEKDNSATTAAKETIQQKVSDSSDSLPPNPGHPDNRTICCYPFVGRESKSAIEDTRMQDKKTVINQSDHQSAHGTAFTEGSQKSEKIDADSTAPLETTITTSIPILDDSRNLVDEQKSPRRSFHVPKMSCCFPVHVTTPSNADHPKDSSGTPATVTTESSIKENEMMIARSSLATTQVVHEDGTESTVTSRMFLVAVDDPNSAPQSMKTVPEVPSASDEPELQTFMFKDDHQITVEDSEKKQDTSRMVGITSGRCMPENGETCENIRKHLKRIKSKLLTCQPKVGEASTAGPQPLLVSTVPVPQEKKDEAMCLEEQEAAARAAALREQELAESIERIKEATLCRKRLLDRQKQESGMHPDLDPYLQFRLCSERTMRRQKAIAAQAERDRQRQFSLVQRGLATSREWEESRRMSPFFFDAKSAAERMRRRQIFLESEQDVFAFAGLAEARDNLVATKRRNMTRAATDRSIARKEAKLMAKRRQDRHMHEAILWEAKRRRHRIAWEARHAGLRIMDRDRQLATKEEEKRQLSLLDTLEILDARTEQENQALETWYDNYKCGPEMPEGDGPEFSIDYFADTASEDEEEDVQEIGTAEQISEPNTVQPLIQPVPTYNTAQPTVAPIS